MSAWSHLPNAAHIDRILAELQANPEKWSMAYDMSHDVARDMAWDMAWDMTQDVARAMAYDMARSAVRIAAWDMARDAAWLAARPALLALVAYDDCAYLLNTKPEHVKTIALLGVPAAVLLYPAVLALQTEELMA